MLRWVRRLRYVLLVAGTAGPLLAGAGVVTSHYLNAAGGAHPSCRYRHTSGQPLPDPTCTPGTVDRSVTQANLAATICRRGYTATVRPAEAVTAVEKRASAIAYGYRGNLGWAEYDHLIPLELGGAPNDPRNLWVEPPSPAHTPAQGVNNPKDQVEDTLNHLVCNQLHLRSTGRGSATSFLPLQAAQQLIAQNWTTALAKARTRTVRQ